MNDKVRGLVFFVLSDRVVKIGQLIKSELAIAFVGAEQVGLIAAVRRELGQLLHVLVAGFRPIAVTETTPAGDLL